MPEVLPDNIFIANDSLKISVVDSIALKIAMDIYTYADFSKVDNVQTFAKQCMIRGVEFAKAYEKFKNSSEYKKYF